MNFTKEINQIDEVTTEVGFVIPLEETEKAYKNALKNVASTAKVKGFRPGKAPQNVIEKMYGGRTRLEVIDDLVKKAINSVIPELDRSEDILTQPQLEFVSVVPDKPIELKATFSFFPRPEVSGYDQIEIELPAKPESSKEDVDKAVERIASSKAKLKKIENRKKLKSGDVVKATLQDRVDKEQEFSQAEPVNLPIGEGFLPEQLEKALIGMEVGTSKEVEVDYPEDYQTAALAGKKVEYKFALEEIHERELPEINDEFAKNLGYENTETVLELRQKLSEIIEKENSQGWEQEKKAKIVDVILEANQFAVPQVMIDQEVRASISHAKQGEEVTEDDLKDVPQEFVEAATKRVRSGIVLMQVANQEKLVATRDELYEYIKKLSQETGVEEELLKQTYLQNNDYASRLQSEITTQKVFDFLDPKVNVKTKKTQKKDTKKSKKKKE